MRVIDNYRLSIKERFIEIFIMDFINDTISD